MRFKRVSSMSGAVDRDELRAAVEREGDQRRQAARIVAKDFVKLFMPRVERLGAFCILLKSKDMRKQARKRKTSVAACRSICHL